jgi:hypothetical protein
MAKYAQQTLPYALQQIFSNTKQQWEEGVIEGESIKLGEALMATTS